MGLNSDFISLARSVQLETTGSDKNLLIDKQSNYNKDIMMDKCQICNEKDRNILIILKNKIQQIKIILLIFIIKI